MSSSSSLMAELEDAVNNRSPEKRVETLRRVTNLFLDESNHLSEHQIGVFDDVLVHLIQRIETKALVQLSSALAPVDNAPVEVIRRLSRHDEITIAGPMLPKSSRLSEFDLVEIAKTKGQGHRLAISERALVPSRDRRAGRTWRYAGPPCPGKKFRRAIFGIQLCHSCEEVRGR